MHFYFSGGLTNWPFIVSTELHGFIVSRSTRRHGINQNLGGIGKATGQHQHIPVDNEFEGLKLIDQVLKRRRQRGYELVNGLADIQAFANAA